MDQGKQLFSVAYDQSSDTLICVVASAGQSMDAAAVWAKQTGQYTPIQLSNEVAVIVDSNGKLLGLRATQALGSSGRLFASGFGMVQFPLPEGQ